MVVCFILVAHPTFVWVGKNGVAVLVLVYDQRQILLPRCKCRSLQAFPAISSMFAV
eukprot:m.113177 g.113177  ORF g.113177 m.113177 type:complete len:56 (+) comp12798_c0_seq2:3241-3408(+)